MISTAAPNEVWSFGEEAYQIIKHYLFMRERLRPYIMKQMHHAHETGIPPMRPLFVDFPSDAVCYQVEDEYMFGPDLLVAPVLEADARSRKVYLARQRQSGKMPGQIRLIRVVNGSPSKHRSIAFHYSCVEIRAYLFGRSSWPMPVVLHSSVSLLRLE